MPEDAATQRDIGRLEGEVQALSRSAERLEAKIDETNRNVAAISRTMAQAEGGWKALVALSSLAAVIGGLVVQFVHWFLGR